MASEESGLRNAVPISRACLIGPSCVDAQGVRLWARPMQSEDLPRSRRPSCTPLTVKRSGDRYDRMAQRVSGMGVVRGTAAIAEQPREQRHPARVHRSFVAQTSCDAQQARLRFHYFPSRNYGDGARRNRSLCVPDKPFEIGRQVLPATAGDDLPCAQRQLWSPQRTRSVSQRFVERSSAREHPRAKRERRPVELRAEPTAVTRPRSHKVPGIRACRRGPLLSLRRHVVSGFRRGRSRR
jgi:hypothetical protein